MKASQKVRDGEDEFEVAISCVRKCVGWFRRRGHKMPSALPGTAAALGISDDLAARLYYRSKIWGLARQKLDEIEHNLAAHLDTEIEAAERYVEQLRVEKQQLTLKLEGKAWGSSSHYSGACAQGQRGCIAIQTARNGG